MRRIGNRSERAFSPRDWSDRLKTRIYVAVGCCCAGACALFPSLSGLTGVDAASVDAAMEATFACDAGWIVCDGACVDPTTPTNCNGCGIVCQTGLCGTRLQSSLTSQSSLWRYNGTAMPEPDAGVALVVQALPQSAGSVVYENPIATDAFTVTFDFRITQLAGRFDGLGFMLQRTGSFGLGGTGGGLGMTGLNGYGVELDTFDNGICGDTSNDHIGIDDLTVCSSGIPTSLFATKDLSSVLDFADGSWHTVVITYGSGNISVALDAVPRVTAVPLPIEAGTQSWFGFGAGVGGAPPGDGGPTGSLHEIRNVDVTFPTPRCL